MSTNSPVNPDYYPWFDWLRIALACIVVIGHDTWWKINGWDESGNLAVQVFFALSGWLIGGILLNMPSTDLPRFYFNRAMRIWVPYFIALGLLLLASLLHDPLTSKWLEFVFYKFSFVYNLFGPSQLAHYRMDMPLEGSANHFWSVNAEEQFYLIAPLLLVLIQPKYGRSVITWVIIALLAWISRTYAASIVFGVLAAVIVNNFGAIHTKYAVRLVLGTLVALSAIGFIAGVDYELLAPICAIAMVLLLAVKGYQHSWGKLVGGMSYPLYLNQWIGVFVANALFKPFGLKDSVERQILSFILNLAIAAGLYWWVDRRILAMRRQLYTARRAQLILGMAYSTVIFGVFVGVTLYWYRDNRGFH
jgi:peptidoglycan/LPS O-acetylase OafA/YrhL